MRELSRREVLRYGFFAGALALVRPQTWAGEMTAAQLAGDPRRPQYHLLPARNWMNDPNGPVYWKGQYHMFYQYNPTAAVWGDMHWGHAVSPDMVRWKHLPVVLSPTSGGADADGCFTGTAVTHDGRVVVLYTGVKSAPESQATIRDGAHSLRESQCLAYSDDPELQRWTKLQEPVIAAPPAGLTVSGFRDPSPWRQGDQWLMAVGSGFRGKGGAVLLYRSRDLRQWEYLHPLVVSESAGSAVNPVDSGDMWECPDFFPLGDKYVLIYSTQGKSRWMTGVFDLKALRFQPEQFGVLDTGAFYAAKTQTDRAGNRILWGWIQETRPVEKYRAAGWAGMMSLPRVLTLGDDGRLRMRVAPEVRELRRTERKLSPTGDADERRSRIEAMKIDSACGEIASRTVVSAGAIGLTLMADGQDGGSGVACMGIRYDTADAGSLMVDGEKVPFRVREAAIELSLHVDSSVIELIVNDQIAHTKRFYLPGNRPRNLRVKWTGDTDSIERFSVWQIAPISANRLTT